MISQALATEKATRYKEMRKTLDDQIIEQEVRRDKYQQLQQPMAMKAIPVPIIRN